jgi:hypothetical protein
MTFVVTPPPPESTILVVKVPLTFLDVLADCQRLESRARNRRVDVPKFADVKVGSASVGSGRG